MIRLADFEKKTSDPVLVTYASTPSGNVPVYEISSFHSLTQLIGFGKYMNREYGNVYLRGQTSLYAGNLPPSALRSSSINYALRISQYKNHIQESTAQTKNFKDRDALIIEPMLQHYGIRTYWLDIVDNVWIALWFAVHKTNSKIIDGREYIHIFENDEDQYGYVFLISSDATKEDESKPGVYNGSQTTLVDLRKAVPSYFLRPHAQHALMLKKNSADPNDFADYSDRIVAIAKISVANALKWIGQTGLLSVQSLFPPPYYDTGYEQLLNEYKIPERCKESFPIKNYVQLFGSIQDITY